MEEIAERTMKGLRNDKRLKQKEMADILGITVSTYAKYENYETKIPYGTAVDFANYFGIKDLRTIKFVK